MIPCAYDIVSRKQRVLDAIRMSGGHGALPSLSFASSPELRGTFPIMPDGT